jgi:hypothetical protein
MMRLASGGSRVQTEASRMVSEKAVAAEEAQVAATASGRSAGFYVYTAYPRDWYDLFNLPALTATVKCTT